MMRLYRDMVKIRTFEEKNVELASQGMLPANPHLCIGQEASIVGVSSNLRLDDYVTSTHRGHGHNIAKGANLSKLMAEIFGKATGYCKGRGGSMHVSAYDVNVMGSFAVVGDGVPVAAGIGLSVKLRKTDQVVACFFGDGATNTGSFAEGLNIAAIWNLPVLFVCENNQYAITTKISNTSRLTNLSDKALGVGIPGITVDGNDVLAVYEAAKRFIDELRRGNGPALLETKTYRCRGSSEGDPNRGLTYRPRDELEEWIKKCPILSYKAKLAELGLLSEEEDARTRREFQKEVEDAVRFAIESPYPQLEEAMSEVFA